MKYYMLHHTGSVFSMAEILEARRADARLLADDEEISFETAYDELTRSFRSDFVEVEPIVAKPDESEPKHWREVK